MRFLCTTALMALLSTGAVSAQSITDLATGGATDALKGAASSAALDSMTAESFDPALLKQLIEQAPVNEATKGTLTQAVEAAEANPELVEAALAQVKSALSM